MTMMATRNGAEMHEVGYTGQHGINWPWIGKTYSPTSHIPEAGEIAAAMVFESPNGNDCVMARWAVIDTTINLTSGNGPTSQDQTPTVAGVRNRLGDTFQLTMSREEYLAVMTAVFWVNKIEEQDADCDPAFLAKMRLAKQVVKTGTLI